MYGNRPLVLGDYQRWNQNLGQTLPSDEAKLIVVYQNPIAQGTVPVVGGLPASIGARVFPIAQHIGIIVVCLPDLTMRRIADMYPGSARTDEKHALIFKNAARTMPHTLGSIRISEEDEAPV